MSKASIVYVEGMSMAKLKRVKICLIIIAFLLVSNKTMFADETMPYLIRMPHRIARGITNIALGWTEILLRPFGEYRTESPFEAMSMGGAHTLMRFGAGFADITTFWVPEMQMLDLYPDWQGWPYLFHWS